MQSFSGKLLLAMPNMGDPRFHRAVILICAHDAGGAMGLVINHPLPGNNFSQLLEQLNIGGTEGQNAALNGVQVLGGGPVEHTRGFLLHTNDFRQAETIIINDDISVTGTVDALRAVAAGQGPRRMVFVLGYSGWTAGQLEREIQENVWLVIDADQYMVFNDDAGEKWMLGMKKLGIDLANLSGDSGLA